MGFRNTSVFSNNIMDGNDVWGIDDMLLYKGIIDFARFTVNYENYKI